MTSSSFVDQPLAVPYGFYSALWSLKSVRFRIAILIALAMTIQAMIRNNLNMALVCMVPIDEIAPSSLNSTKSADLCGREPLNTSFPQQVIPPSYVTRYQVDWSMSEQGRIHSAYYVGSLMSVFVASQLTDRFGGKNLITVGVVINSLGTLLTPLVAILFARYEIIVVLRFIMGFAQGFLVPCGSLILAKWFTVHEKSTAMAIFTTGNQVGLALAMFSTAQLCQVDFIGGWPSAFILSSVVALLFLLVWIPFASDRPRDSKYITAAELEHINGQTVKHRAMSISVSTPYTKILLCPVVLAICLCSFCQSFVMVSLATYLPQYNQSALKLDISSNGLWASVPFMVQMVTKFIFAFVADHLKKRHVSVNLVTKCCNSVASFLGAICIIWISFLGCGDYVLVLSLLCISMGIFSGYVPGYNTSIVSVAPIFTAHISAYAQFYAQLASTIAPALIGIMTNDDSTNGWSTVFYMLAGVLIASGVFFQLFGSATVVPWAIPEELHIPKNDRSSARLVPLNQEQTEMDFLALPRTTKRTPKVSIMEDGDEYPSLPGEYGVALEDSVIEEGEQSEKE